MKQEHGATELASVRRRTRHSAQFHFGTARFYLDGIPKSRQVSRHIRYWGEGHAGLDSALMFRKQQRRGAGGAVPGDVNAFWVDLAHRGQDEFQGVTRIDQTRFGGDELDES